MTPCRLLVVGLDLQCDLIRVECERLIASLLTRETECIESVCAIVILEFMLK
jgi:hypothetical protein